MSQLCASCCSLTVSHGFLVRLRALCDFVVVRFSRYMLRALATNALEQLSFFVALRNPCTDRVRCILLRGRRGCRAGAHCKRCRGFKLGFAKCMCLACDLTQLAARRHGGQRRKICSTTMKDEEDCEGEGTKAAQLRRRTFSQSVSCHALGATKKEARTERMAGA